MGTVLTYRVLPEGTSYEVPVILFHKTLVEVRLAAHG
jgi:hypothetical protein